MKAAAMASTKDISVCIHISFGHLTFGQRLVACFLASSHVTLQLVLSSSTERSSFYLEIHRTCLPRSQAIGSTNASRRCNCCSRAAGRSCKAPRLHLLFLELQNATTPLDAASVASRAIGQTASSTHSQYPEWVSVSYFPSAPAPRPRDGERPALSSGGRGGGRVILLFPAHRGDLTHFSIRSVIILPSSCVRARPNLLLLGHYH